MLGYVEHRCAQRRVVGTVVDSQDGEGHQHTIRCEFTVRCLTADDEVWYRELALLNRAASSEGAFMKLQ